MRFFTGAEVPDDAVSVSGSGARQRSRHANDAGDDAGRFSDDPACDYLDRQYMLGDAVMVAPVFE
ncbi:hypothetical protein KCP74_06090 [Salmonella enterica subsp. enterica]|nr:hypothetical protein KCP74_06090 [Salmonella enterica subsp. enterica]